MDSIPQVMGWRNVIFAFCLFALVIKIDAAQAQILFNAFSLPTHGSRVNHNATQLLTFPLEIQLW